MIRAGRKEFLTLLMLSALLFYPRLRAGGAEGTEVRHIRDCAGRQVVVKGKVRRIACLYAFSGHVVTMLGRGKDIVAVVNGLKRDVMLTRICPSIQKAVVPRRNGAVNIEELVSVRPDVVFVQSHMGKSSSLCAMLEKFNIPCLIVSYRDIRGQQKAIKIIGRAIGEKKRAEDFLYYYDTALSRAAEIARKIPQRERKRLFHSILEPLKTDGPGVLSADLTSRAATINVSVNKRLHYSGSDYFAEIEQVIKWNPEVILVNEEGVKEHIERNPRWRIVKAVVQGSVYKMPTGVSRWGHPGSLETPLALLWILKKVYPRYTYMIDMRQETKVFYNRFFRLSLTDRDVDKILSGKGMRRMKGRKKRKRR